MKKFSTIKIVAKIAVAIFLGFTIIFFYLLNNKNFKKSIENKIKIIFYQNIKNINFDFKIKKITFFPLKIYCSNLKITEQNTNFVIKSNNFEIIISLFELFKSFKIKYQLFLKDLFIKENYNIENNIYNFLKQLFSISGVSFFYYDYLNIENGNIELLYNNKISLNASFTSNLYSSNQNSRIQCFCKNGTINYYDTAILNAISGNIIAEYKNVINLLDSLNLKTNLNFKLPSSNLNATFFCIGTLNNSNGNFFLSDENKELLISKNNINLNKENAICNSIIASDLNIIKNIKQFNEIANNLEGKILINSKFDLYNLFSNFDSTIELKKLIYNKYKICDNLNLKLKSKNNNLYAFLNYNNKKIAHGIIKYIKNKFIIKLFNSTNLKLSKNSYWSSKPNAINTNIIYEIGKKIYGNYSAKIYSTQLENEIKSSGIFNLENKKITLKNKIDTKDFDIKLYLYPNFFIKYIICKNAKEILLKIHSEKNFANKISGFFYTDFISFVLPEKFKTIFNGNEPINIEVILQNKNYILKLFSNNINIKIPKIYNVIQNFYLESKIDFINKKLLLEKFNANLYEGKIYSNNYSFQLNKLNQLFIFGSLFFDNIMINSNKGIFLIISAEVLMKKLFEKKSKLKANIIIKKSRLSGNILSKNFQEKLIASIFSKSINPNNKNIPDFDINISTKEPLQIQTSFLNLKSNLNLKLKNNKKFNNLVTGELNFIKGKFKFPYKPLNIINGKIIFNSEANQIDPIIDITAKNKIKNYIIEMKISGKTSDPKIHFNSSPNLTEEQIIALLLSGTENNSLGMILPSLLIQGLNDLFFGPALSKTKLKKQLKYLLNPLKYVKFYPKFTNQIGGSGISGSIEIDASEKLHVKCDSNFTKLEDTRVEINYDLTDDTSLIFSKDGPGSYSGEIEMRWSFN